MWRKSVSKKFVYTILLFIYLLFAGAPAQAQCSICTRTSEQMGEQPAKGMNAGILYLAFTPFALIGIIAYRWWKNNRKN